MKRQLRRKHSPHPRSVSDTPKASDLLLEIGTEELPAAYLPKLIEQLADEARELFREDCLLFKDSDVESFGTPRRLVLIVRQLCTQQSVVTGHIWGPLKAVCYDAANKPTPALLGFLRSHGATEKDIEFVPSEKGERVRLEKKHKRQPAIKVLAESLPRLIQRLHTPKMMRWDETGVRFARPIRWLLVLYGSKLLNVCLIPNGTETKKSLKSTPFTFVGGPKRPRRIVVKSVENYFQLLKRAGVLLDQKARRAAIERQVSNDANRAGGEPAREAASHGLWEEVTSLVEQPWALTASFDPKYLTLPREVLLASMSKHQRVFAVERHGKLLPKCVAILEGKPGKPAMVKSVIERILNARLSDALLFWNEDRRQPLSTIADRLSGVTFHEKLGSMKDKADRLHRLTTILESVWQLSPEQLQQLRRACELAKIDLVTAMVKEFPTLQGIMGKHYAKASGESNEVAEAIEEHYLPISERLPKTLVGSALSILDKYDTLVAYFGAKILPTGDQDPYGLRRAAQGIVEVAWAVHRSLPFHPFREVFTSQGWFKTMDMGEACDQVQRYLLERLYTFSWSNPLPSVDCINAVLESSRDDLVDVMDRIAMLARLKTDPALTKAAKVVERTHNILKGATFNHRQVDSTKFQDPLEKKLGELYFQQKDKILWLIGKHDYAKATQHFGDVFFDPIHEFFAKVMVNVPDEALRQNRLALMKAIKTLYTERVADLSKLTLLSQS